jgi:hypothetical protein
MRRTMGAMLAGLLLFTGAAPGRADEQAELRTIIQKAIDARGGAEKLAKQAAMTWKEKGTYHGMGNALPFESDCAVQWPAQFRLEIVGIFTLVLDGDKGWIRANNETREMTKDELAEQKEEHYCGWVTALTPLKDKAFALAPLGEVKVEDRPAVGVRVSRTGHRDVNLFFDKKSGLLAKAEYTVKSPELGGQEVTQEVSYQDYREIEGVKHPIKVVLKRDGKLFVEGERSDLKPAAKLAEGTFAKP